MAQRTGEGARSEVHGVGKSVVARTPGCSVSRWAFVPRRPEALLHLHFGWSLLGSTAGVDRKRKASVPTD